MHLIGGNFTQRHDNLAIIGIDTGLGTLDELARPNTSEHDEFKATLNVI